MPNVKIEGDLCGEFTVDGKDFSRLPAKDYQAALQEVAVPNYKPMEGWVVCGRGSEPWLLRVKDGIGPNGLINIKEVIDCQTMYSTANAGHGNYNILSPIATYLFNRWAPTGNGLTNHLQLAAFTALQELVGFPARIITKTGGGEAVDTAIKAARRFWWARHSKPAEADSRYGPYIIVAANAFHGRPLGATSLFPYGSSSRKGFAPFPEGTRWVPFNDADAIEIELRMRRDIAGVLLEPIQGEGGIIVPGDNYLRRVEKLCRHYGTLFMLDEVQTGFGRTGANFAFEHYGVTPDILILGKALGGGAIPASAVIGRKNVRFDGDATEYDVLSCLAEDGPGEEGATWSGAALVCLAILAAVRELCDKNLAERAAVNGAQFLSELKTLKEKYPLIADVRGKGLMIGADFVAPRSDDPFGVRGRIVSHALLREGVWAYYTGEKKQTLRFLPPLVTPPEVLSEVVHRLERVVWSFTG